MKNRDDAAEAAMLFSVPDFVGDACKAIASRIRGSVASVQFDDFHKVGDFVSFFSIISIISTFSTIHPPAFTSVGPIYVYQ